MARQFTETKIVIASHNAGKVSEIADLLSPLGVSVISAGEAGLPEPEETGKTFIENAEMGRRAEARETSADETRIAAQSDSSELSPS